MNRLMKRIYSEWFALRKINMSYDGYYFIWEQFFVTSLTSEMLPKRFKIENDMWISTQITVDDLWVGGNLTFTSFLPHKIPQKIYVGGNLFLNKMKEMPEECKVIGEIFYMGNDGFLS